MESVIGEAGPSSPRPVTAAAEEVPVPGEPAMTLQEHVAPKGTAMAASLEIQEAEEGTGATLLQGAASGEAQTLELACTRGRLPSNPATTLRTARRSRHTAPWRVGSSGRTTRSMS
jgi:hypothetical protein